jgi:hypothetical protein
MLSLLELSVYFDAPDHYNSNDAGWIFRHNDYSSKMNARSAEIIAFN